MTWNPHTSNGFESDKCRFDVLPYVARGGLDIGCGARKVWPHLIGIDSGLDTQLFGTQMRPDIVVQSADRLSMFASDSIDSVFSSHLLEHIVNWQMALAEWWRLVKPGGHLVLYLPHKQLYPNIGQPGANPDHKHDFMPEDIVQGMRDAGPDWSLLVNETRGERNEYSFLQVYRKEAAGHGWQFPHTADKPKKTAAIVRIGAKGDALWASSPAKLLKEAGYHVTMYVAATGEEVLRHDPHVDRIICLPDRCLSDNELLLYWLNEAPKYTRWINLIGSVEQRLLYHQSANEFFLPLKLRQRFADANYLEMVHDYAGVEHVFHQQFYATADELATAKQLRSFLPAGPLVVVNACGSGPAKTWPHLQAFLKRMNEAKVATVVLGDLRDLDVEELQPYVGVVGNEWPVRMALAFTQLADAVVGTESMLINSVASLPMLKVALLSHSSAENLTKHWVNTIALAASAIGCHPCHRIHADMSFCARDRNTGASACMATYGADFVADQVLQRIVPAPVVEFEPRALEMPPVARLALAAAATEACTGKARAEVA